MTTASPTLAAAEARAALARERLAASLAEARDRLAPARLIDDGRRQLGDRASIVGRRAADDMAARPALYATVAGGVMLFLLRHQAADLCGRIAAHARRSRTVPPTAPYPGDRLPDPTERKDES